MNIGQALAFAASAAAAVGAAVYAKKKHGSPDLAKKDRNEAQWKTAEDIKREEKRRQLREQLAEKAATKAPAKKATAEKSEEPVTTAAEVSKLVEEALVSESESASVAQVSEITETETTDTEKEAPAVAVKDKKRKVRVRYAPVDYTFTEEKAEEDDEGEIFEDVLLPAEEDITLEVAESDTYAREEFSEDEEMPDDVLPELARSVSAPVKEEIEIHGIPFIAPLGDSYEAPAPIAVEEDVPTIEEISVPDDEEEIEAITVPEAVEVIEEVKAVAVTEESLAFDEFDEAIKQPPVAEEPVASVVEDAEEIPAVEEIAEVAEEAPAVEEIAEVAEEAPAVEEIAEVAEEVPAVEEVAEVAEEVPAVEEIAEVAEEVPAVEEVAEEAEEAPAVEEVAEAVEETPAVEAVAEVAEEAPAVEEVAEEAEEAPAVEEVAEEAEEVPVVEEVAEVAEEAPAVEEVAEAVEETPATEILATVSETPAIQKISEAIGEAPLVAAVSGVIGSDVLFEEVPVEENKPAEISEDEFVIEEQTVQQIPVFKEITPAVKAHVVEEVAEEAEEAPATQTIEEISVISEEETEEIPVSDIIDEETDEAPVEQAVEVVEEIAPAPFVSRVAQMLGAEPEKEENAPVVEEVTETPVAESVTEETPAVAEVAELFTAEAEKTEEVPAETVAETPVAEEVTETVPEAPVPVSKPEPVIDTTPYTSMSIPDIDDGSDVSTKSGNDLMREAMIKADFGDLLTDVESAPFAKGARTLDFFDMPDETDNKLSDSEDVSSVEDLFGDLLMETEKPAPEPVITKPTEVFAMFDNDNEADDEAFDEVNDSKIEEEAEKKKTLDTRRQIAQDVADNIATFAPILESLNAIRENKVRAKSGIIFDWEMRIQALIGDLPIKTYWRNNFENYEIWTDEKYMEKAGELLSMLELVGIVRDNAKEVVFDNETLQYYSAQSEQLNNDFRIGETTVVVRPCWKINGKPARKGEISKKAPFAEFSRKQVSPLEQMLRSNKCDDGDVNIPVEEDNFCTFDRDIPYIKQAIESGVCKCAVRRMEGGSALAFFYEVVGDGESAHYDAGTLRFEITIDKNCKLIGRFRGEKV